MALTTFPTVSSGGVGTYYPFIVTPRPSGNNAELLIAYAVIPAGTFAAGVAMRFKVAYTGYNNNDSGKLRLGPTAPTATNNTAITGALGAGATGYGSLPVLYSDGILACTAAGASGSLTAFIGGLVTGGSIAYSTGTTTDSRLTTTVDTTVTNYLSYTTTVSIAPTATQLVFGASLERTS